MLRGIHLVWLYIALFLVALILGILDVPQWMFLLIFIPFASGILYLTIYPDLFSRDIEKVMSFLKNSKHPHYQFTYYFFNGELKEAEREIPKIRSKQIKTVDEIILLTRQGNFASAKKLLPALKDNVYKWYYGAMIAIHEGEQSEYKHYKRLVKDKTYLTFLDIEEKIREGKKGEALAMVEEQMKKHRGVKLLSAIHYKKEIVDR
jgi:hypothetical protein